MKYLSIVIVVVIVIIGAVFVYLNDSVSEPEEVVNGADTKEQIEIQFENDRASLTKIEATLGESASRGFRYFFYHDGSVVRTIREVWEGNEENAPEIRYYYFEDENLVLTKRLRGTSEQLDAMNAGSDEHTTTRDKIYFENGKMVKWIGEDGQEFGNDDPLWEEIESKSLSNTNYFVTDFRKNFLTSE